MESGGSESRKQFLCFCSLRLGAVLGDERGRNRLPVHREGTGNRAKRGFIWRVGLQRCWQRKSVNILTKIINKVNLLNIRSGAACGLVADRYKTQKVVGSNPSPSPSRVATIRSAQLLGPWGRSLTPHCSRGDCPLLSLINCKSLLTNYYYLYGMHILL